MKIAFVNDALHPWEKGGVQKRIWEVSRRMSDQHDVHVYGMKYWDGPDTIERHGVKIHGICEPQGLYTAGGRRSITQAIKFSSNVVRPLRRAEFDIVESQKSSYFPVLATGLTNALSDTTHVGLWTEVWDDYWYDYMGYMGVLGKVIERCTIKMPESIIALSDHIAADLERVGRSRNISVVPNGVDYDHIQQIPAAQRDWDFLYAGRLSDHKNVALLLDAIAELRSAGLEELDCGIIGTGPAGDDLQAKAAALDLQDTVTLLGYLEDSDDLFGHMKAADVFVHPSVREGFPTTILEANACGTPCVIVDAPKNGGTAVVEHGETGFITEPTAAALAAQILEVLADDDLRARVVEAANEFAAAHDWSLITDQLVHTYRSILEQSIGENRHT
jgi:glycosyltransferase involved in cell wall biosynthesis